MINNKGVTLVALVITIVLMLILVGVTVTNFRNYEVFDYAGKAINKSELLSIIEGLKAEEVFVGKNNLNGTLSEILGNDYSKYDSTFKVVNGELIYLGTNENTIETLFELGQGEGTIEIASSICAVKGHNYKPANYLEPKTCTRCGQTEGEVLVAEGPHPDQNNSEDIGIGTDGQLVNLDNWTYTTNPLKWTLTGYTGTYSERGEIEGKVPQIINGSNVTAMRSTFSGVTQLKVVPDIPVTVTDTLSEFNGCVNIETLPNNLSFENLTISQNMFSGCTKIETLPETALLSSKIRYANSMFVNCSGLKSLPTNFTIPEGCNYIQDMFRGCSSLEELPAGFTIPPTVQNMTSTFSGCTNLKSLPDNFRIADGVTNMWCTFYQCPNLSKLPDNFTVPASVTNIGLAFRLCPKLEGTITILGNPTTYNAAFNGTATSGNGLTVKYTSACTNIESIRATVSSGANITFQEISLASKKTK